MQKHVRRAIDYLRNTWKWLAEFHRTRFIANLTKEDHEELFRQNFDRGKKLSDFIGMIVRYAFANFAWVYFLKQAPETDGIRGWALGLCATFAFGVYLVLGLHIYSIILFYETKDLHKQTRKAVKIIMFIMSSLIVFALWYGINDLVTSLRSSALPK